MPNDLVVQSNKDLALNEQPDGAAVERKDHTVILEFDVATSVRKTSVKGGGFVRYPFELQDLGNIELTNNKYLIDIVGYITNVGRTTHQRTGSRTLDFYLTNGSDGEGALNQVTVNVDHSQPKDWTFENLLIWARNRKNDVTMNVDHSQPKDGTFENLLIWARNRKNDGWNYPSCGGSKCKKGIDRKAGSFWCDSCNKPVEYQVLRFRLELDISDQTASTVVVRFDDTATKLKKLSCLPLCSDCRCPSYLAPSPRNVIGTTHHLELKSHTYYEHSTFESFTYWRIVPEEVVEESAGSSNINANVHAKRKRVKTLAMHPFVSTPSKPVEDKKKKRLNATQHFTVVAIGNNC
nr:hypothetical protein [Tanacetum cinerariifolium]